MILLEAGNLNGVIALVLLMMLSPAILLTIVGFAIRKKRATAAKVLFIIAGLYVLIGLGICGVLISQ